MRVAKRASGSGVQMDLGCKCARGASGLVSKCARVLVEMGCKSTVVATSVLTRYYVNSENQLLLCKNLGLKNSLYLI